LSEEDCTVSAVKCSVSLLLKTVKESTATEFVENVILRLQKFNDSYLLNEVHSVAYTLH